MRIQGILYSAIATNKYALLPQNRISSHRPFGQGCRTGYFHLSPQPLNWSATMENQAKYLEAKRQVERKLRFGVHLAIYLAVNAVLALSHWQHQDAQLWSFGPLAGWGIGVLFHGLHVMLRAPRAAWKQRMIARELQKNT